MTFTYNKALTTNRIARLSQYMEKNVLRGDEFICKHFAACKCSRPIYFYEGHPPHVGTHYDLLENSVPLRIMVVGQEDGSKDRKVSLEARHTQIAVELGLEKRFNKMDGHKGRNPHMRGTTSALRLLVGRQPGTDYDAEFIHFADGSSCHLFESFALVNALICSSHISATSSVGNSSSTMFDNCSRHFRASIEILEPTVMVVQGATVWKKVKRVLGNLTQVNRQETIYRTKINGNPILIAALYHPSAQSPDANWSDQNRPYLQNTVVPTIAQIRMLLFGKAPTN
jgi:uracil-DNA glycosylase family 4